jgi:hypothetical protein
MLKKNRKITLPEFNDMKLNKHVDSFDHIDEVETTLSKVLKCGLCGGKLEVVEPIVKMDGLTLLECPDCFERIYLDIS